MDLFGSHTGIIKHIQKSKAGNGCVTEGIVKVTATMTNCAAPHRALFTLGASEDLPGRGHTTQSQLHNANTQGHF